MEKKVTGSLFLYIIQNEIGKCCKVIKLMLILFYAQLI